MRIDRRLRLHAARGCARRQRLRTAVKRNGVLALRVVLPAFGDTAPGSVGQRFRPATTCAAPDVIADVGAHTPAHSLRSHRTRLMLTPRQVETAQNRAHRERTTKRANTSKRRGNRCGETRQNRNRHRNAHTAHP